jgi:hypothetical protein
MSAHPAVEYAARRDGTQSAQAGARLAALFQHAGRHRGLGAGGSARWAEAAMLPNDLRDLRNMVEFMRGMRN